MPRSKKFFALILILLLVNAAFFISWYWLGMRVRFREMLAYQLGKAAKGKIEIQELNFSDKQLFAEGVSYTSADSSIVVEVKRIRAQYNVLRFIVSGFKPSRLLRQVEIIQPHIAYSLHPKVKVKKAKKPFKLPDIAPYFSRLDLRDGSLDLSLEIPLKIVSKYNLGIKEHFSELNISVVNSGTSSIKLSAVSRKQGKLNVKGYLDKGCIRNVEAELEAYHPNYINHNDIADVSTEISLFAELGQQAAGKPFTYKAQTQIWGTQLTFAEKYPVRIPFLGAEIEGKNLKAQLTRSSFGTSSIEAEVQISELGKKLKFDSASAKGSLDLAMITEGLKGLVDFSLEGQGTIKEPQLSAKISSPMLGYKQHIIKELHADADFADNTLNIELPNAVYQNQNLELSGSYSMENKAISATISTYPVNKDGATYTVSTNIDVYAELLDRYPLVETFIHDMDFHTGSVAITGVNGYVKLIPVAADKNYYVDANLNSNNGYSLALVGDLLDRNLLLDADFRDLSLKDIYSQKAIAKLNPNASGSLRAIMQGDDIYMSTHLDAGISEPVVFNSHLEGVGGFNVKTLDAALSLEGTSGTLNDQDLQFSLSSAIENKRLRINGLKVNDFLSLSGDMSLQDPADFGFDLALNDISARDIVSFYPDLDTSLPGFRGLSLFAKYNREGEKQLSAQLSLAYLDLIAVTPLALNLALQGPIEEVAIHGDIRSNQQNLFDISGLANIQSKLNLKLNAQFAKLKLEELLLNSTLMGSGSGNAGIELTDLLGVKPVMTISADMKAQDLKIGSIKIREAVVDAVQSPNKLQVDSLYVVSDDLFSVQGSGAIDYNVIKREFFEGNDKLNIKAEGQLFPWLKQLTSYIEESKGYSALNFSLGSQDDQFMLYNGNLDIHSGFLRLKDQSEALENITIKGSFDRNKVIIERGSVKMGEGSLVFNNMFEADNSDHFMLGFIDLGILRLMVEEPGILLNMPMFSPPRTLSNITLKGRDSRYATVRGPFDRMKISAEVQLSNSDVLYPPNTANLLKLASSLRDVTAKRSTNDPLPLPFSLDVMITLGENVAFVTYPTHLQIQQGGYLHLLYDGQKFSVKDANFSTERGTIDIFGTVFQVEKVDINMVEAQNLLSVNGIFTKRAPDGTMITLGVSTSPDLSKSFSERLEFSLTSDNPEDRNISQILARLRYNQTGDITEEQKGIPLQDEALSLISGNLDSSLITPFLSPVESFVRRKLKLDGFSIGAGFIQNLYTQYSTDPNQLADYTDMKHFTNDIAQFSSAILLNNLSLSMSKYLGRSLFLDYKLELQEATDLQNKTKLMISHETSMRYMLPKRYRLAYTFKYLPQEKEMSHEIMLQRSFRFWGL